MEVQTEVQTNAPICKTQICKRPLTYLEDTKCWRCLVCNPLPKPKLVVEEKKKNPVPVPSEIKEMIEAKFSEQVEIGEERIREIVRDELENWHIQKPPVTRLEVTDQAKALGLTVVDTIAKPETWLQKAKRLGVQTHNEGTGGMRKKVDILKDIEAKTKEIDDGRSGGTEDQSEDNGTG